MVRITLPDNSVKEFAAPTTGAEIAAGIGAGLAKAALAIEVDGKPQDLSEPIAADAKVNIATVKGELGLDTMRHTVAAQVLARAIKEMYPGAKLAIGPTVDNGFYYDVEFSAPLSSEDLPKIEERMHAIIKEGNSVTRELWDAEELKAHFKKTGDDYKLEIIDDVAAKGQLLPGGKVSAYRQGNAGENFIDLCVGPHVPDLGKITGAFKLTNIAGAYWRGDSANKQLTRIYGVMFATQKELDAYLVQRAEAEKRDHRKIGPALDLFHFQEEAPGQAFWHPAGWTIYTELTDYLRRKLDRAGYVEVNTPKLVDKVLYEKSGHWANYFDDLFLVKDEHEGKVVGIHALKPMNCPCHVQVFNVGIKSYRDLPLRMAEFGSCMRNESHGALHGLMRVRAFTQDDAHIFCTTEQIQEESIAFCALLKEVYADLGFENYFLKLSTRPEKRIGSDEIWDIAENALMETCKRTGMDWKISPGDGAFYGPKLEFTVRDSIGRDWQLGTLQVDFNMPQRLDAFYTAEDGSKQHPVMLHRAILGSLERFIGVLIENSEGKFPVWLSPVQAIVIPITDKQNDYADDVAAKLRAAAVTATGGLRVEVDASNERMQKKILFAQQRKIPYMLVVGDKEREAGTVAVRLRDGTDLGAVKLEAFMERIGGEIAARRDVQL
ncbi:MAG TPA: threonine--tRNA ligase [Alphaproteobacteria bacterium]|nr:threonine--tRNA ligase [Alphaproteobacteria bacterium]